MRILRKSRKERRERRERREKREREKRERREKRDSVGEGPFLSPWPAHCQAWTTLFDKTLVSVRHLRPRRIARSSPHCGIAIANSADGCGMHANRKLTGFLRSRLAMRPSSWMTACAFWHDSGCVAKR